MFSNLHLASYSTLYFIMYIEMGSFFSSQSQLSTESNIYKDFIDDKLKANQIVVFSRTNCGYCTRAKETLRRLSLDYYPIELDIDDNCPQRDCQNLITNLIKQTRMKTVPQIFINGQLIGGFGELQQLVNAGKLSTLLNSKQN